MRTLHVDITWLQIYDLVTKRQPIGFVCKRTDIQFENVEKEYSTTNFELPFGIDILAIPSIKSILAIDAQMNIGISPINRIRMAVKLNGGNIWYERLGNESSNDWRVTIGF